MDVATVLDLTADYLQLYGKSVGGAYDYLHRPCVMMALQHVVDYQSGVRDVACQRLRIFIGGEIAEWSDGNDEATVLAGLRALAVIERAKQLEQEVCVGHATFGEAETAGGNW